MKAGLFSLLLLLFLTNPLFALQKGDLVFRSLPSPMLSWIPDHVAISVDGAFKLIAAERNHMKEKGKKIKHNMVEYTDLRDHYWVTYGRVRKTSILESSPAFKELSPVEQEQVREAIVQFAVKRYGEKFDYPFDGIDDDPHTWFCSQLPRAAYEAAIAPFIGRPGKVRNLSSPSHRIDLPFAEEFGLRPDGTKKGLGYFGVLKRPDGKVSTELSIGVEFDGKETEIPSLVPTLNKDEINYLLTSKLEPSMWKTPTGKVIVGKAVEHAKKRIAEGKSPFAEEGEQYLSKQQPSKERIIRVTWTPARDDASLKDEIDLPYTAWGQYFYTPKPDPKKGVAGYSITWDHTPHTLPDTTMDIRGKVTQISSPTLKKGTWYFHIRSLDRAGHWSEEAAHLGPFRIE